MGGFIKFNVFPKQASTIVVASVEFPDGTPFTTTQQAVERLETTARRAAEILKTRSGEGLIVNTLATVGQEADEKAGHTDTASPPCGRSAGDPSRS